MSKSKLVGIVACSGEELPEGTVTRAAAWMAFGKLKSPSLVATCLPLFLAGQQQERDFARDNPTITIEGCEKRCAEKAIRMFGGNPKATFVVTDVENETGLTPKSRDYLGETGKKLADIVAERVKNEIKKILSEGHEHE
ncbi:MAG: putative zinc-binding protein [Candidatus Bathyarchaeaceae archaeon]